MTHKLFSFFSGAGFLDLGFESENYQTVLVNENHTPFLEAYQYARKQIGIEAPAYGYCLWSVTDFYKAENHSLLTNLVKNSRQDGSLVGFIGGPPCPDFSIAGKNRGKLGENGRLSKTYIDLICEQKPDFFLFENVKGLWNTKRHKQFFDELKLLLWKAGYITAERLINSIEYGVPQNRERIILLGFRKEIFPLDPKPYFTKDGEFSFFPWLKFASYPNQKAFNYQWPTTSPFVEDEAIPCPPEIPIELTIQHWFEKNQVDIHPNAVHCFRPKAGLAKFKIVPEGDDSKKSFKRLHRWRYSPTAAYGNNEVHLHPYKARRISVAEALAIQSLPSNFMLPQNMTLSNMFKTVGNGVPYLAAQMIARSIKLFLENPYEQIDSIGHHQSHHQTSEESALQLH